ncbi:MAG: class I SAM-dependent methyltransferase [Caldilineaceae bacterium]
MTPTPANDPKQVATQYATSANLDARIRLHADYSTNQYGWLPWVFDQLLTLPATATILEVGCGTGQLWAENQRRIPNGWTLILSDQSTGMLDKSSAILAHLQRPLHFEQIDAQQIPYEDAHFDAVIANHMLYHVPDLPQTLGEIHRVLKPGGKLFAATNGRAHMVELSELAGRFDDQLHSKSAMAIDNFLLENGKDQLTTVFDSVTCPIYEDALVVDEADALVDYILSMAPTTFHDAAKRQALRDFIQRTMVDLGGHITIAKSTGLFIATKGAS